MYRTNTHPHILIGKQLMLEANTYTVHQKLKHDHHISNARVAFMLIHPSSVRPKRARTSTMSKLRVRACQCLCVCVFFASTKTIVEVVYKYIIYVEHKQFVLLALVSQRHTETYTNPFSPELIIVKAAFRCYTHTHTFNYGML